MALITIRTVTTLLTPEQYGQLSLLITVQAFCGLFLVNPVGQYINLRTHAWWDDGTLVARLKSYWNYLILVSLVGALVVLGLGAAHSKLLVLWPALVMFVMVCAGTWNSTLIPMLNMLGFRALSVVWSIITVALGLVCSIVLVRWLPSAQAWFAGQALGMLGGALGAVYIARGKIAAPILALKKMPLLSRSTIVSYCLPLAVATGFMWLQLNGYRFVIESYWGLAQLGFLVIGFQLAGQIWALTETMAMQFLTPLFYRRVSDNNDNAEIESAFSDLLNTLVPVYLVITGLLVFCAPYMLKVLVAAKFQGATTPVMLGAVIELCRVLGNLLTNAAHVRRKTKSLSLPYAVGSLTAVGLMIVAGSLKLGVIWAGAALVAGAVAMFAVMVVGMYRQVKFTLDTQRCLIGCGFLCVMVLLLLAVPKISGLIAAIGMLILAGLFSASVILILLWKNPATLRLVNVRLRGS